MSCVFINYRREDTSSQASRLYEWLEEHYGEEKVFKDVDTIEPGLDWREAIERAMGSSAVVIALIGKDWLAELREREATSRDDFVCEELEEALRRDVRVIPVLVEGAAMPSPEDLPDGLVPLTRRQAYEMSDARWRFDKEELLKRTDRILGVTTPAPVRPEPARDNAAAVEAELDKWNWGAFLLTFVWGLGHGVYRSFLVFVPFYGFYEWYLLGAKGNRWAWEQRRWDSVESFRRTQRKWAKWGIAIAVIGVLIAFGSTSAGSSSG